MNTGNPVVWFEIYVNDLARAKKFYETVLATELTKLPAPEEAPFEMLAFPADMESKNAISGALVHTSEVKAGNNSTIVYFTSKDCSEASRIEPSGGKVLNPKMSIGEYGFVVLATDTEGNVFGIHSME